LFAGSVSVVLETVEGMLMRLLRRCGSFGGLGAAALVAALFVSAGPAEGAFPGRDGLLAVQPLSGAPVALGVNVIEGAG
jgi:hypothetical protein